MNPSPATVDQTPTAAVLKFGGSSFATPQAYQDIAGALAERVHTGKRRLAVIVSAMPGETESLRDRLAGVNPHPADASTAGLLTLADTISAHLLAAALHEAGLRATVLAGHELGFTTDSTFMWARLLSADPAPLTAALAENEVVVIPGGQAVDATGRPTWLGKNSSDLSALIAAATLGATEVEIHSDVDGVYSCDPNAVTGTRLLSEISYDSAALMSLHGAKVLHRHAVRLAKQHGIAIVCRLNKAPFPSGTTIGARGSAASAVVVNKKSVVLEFGDDAAADIAHSTFHAQGLDSVRLETGAHVALTNGYLDLEGFGRRHELPPYHPVGIPVAEVSGSQVITTIAADVAEAVEVAQQIHDALYAQTPQLLSV